MRSAAAFVLDRVLAAGAVAAGGAGVLRWRRFLLLRFTGGGLGDGAGAWEGIADGGGTGGSGGNASIALDMDLVIRWFGCGTGAPSELLSWGACLLAN